MIEAFVFLFIVVSVWGFTKWRKLHKQEQLHAWIGWAAGKDNFVRYNKPLWMHLKEAQRKANIPERYQISGDEEWEAAKSILEEYQQDLTQNFLTGSVPVIKEKLSPTENINTAYFVFSLYVFLCNNGRCGLVGTKMQYITYRYSRQSTLLKDLVPLWCEEMLVDRLKSFHC
jgi:hypothetical protein